MLSFSRLSIKSLLLAAAFTATGIASATPISGSFSLTSFGGSYVGGTATTATGLDFGSVGGGIGNGYGTNGTALVGNASGSFANLGGSIASVSDIQLGATANPYLVNPFISFGGSTIMVNFSNATITRSTTGTSVTVAGLATFSDGIAADASNGTFSLSANSQDGTNTGVNLTFTSNVSAPAVAVTPEPSSLVLLGTGLIGGATTLLRRRKLVA
ncbi:MAG: PEP-CTERM sorting domain-containing protein [Janthinobacterium lividum]